MSSTVRYRMEEAVLGSPHLEQLLAEGWEPFAVIETRNATLIYLRRLVA